MFDINEIFIESFMTGFMPVINMFLIPLLIWVVLPGALLNLLKKGMYPVGAFIGLIGLLTLGPFSDWVL